MPKSSFRTWTLISQSEIPCARVVAMGRSKLMADGIKACRADGTRVPGYCRPVDPEVATEREQEQEEEGRKRKRDEEEAERRKWVNGLKGRNFTCEQQVDRTKMGAHPIIKVIEQKGLLFFFSLIEGYKPKLVVSFYAKMVVHKENETIESRIGNKMVTVNPTIIATYLGDYQRLEPHTITYPDELYRVINMVVHYNLFPHGFEKMPHKPDGEVLYVFGSNDDVVDLASSSRPIAPRGPERNEQWWEIMMCHFDTIQKEQSELRKVIEKEIRRRKKKEDKMMRMLRHVSGYGKGSVETAVGFKAYGVNNTFKDYAKKGVTFAQYANLSSNSNKGATEGNGVSVNKWVEPGKFFREYLLKEGTIMKIPDIRDKMPKRSFLPRVISSKLPFSTGELLELKQIFHAQNESYAERVLVHALSECKRNPSIGETKRCVGSIEDMIDFAVSVLGHNATVRTTANVNGSNQNVMIGKVKGIDGGEVTKSVSCHQSLYPYLLYYCNSVPKVRVYVSDIVDVESKVKITEGVAICHIDTSAWSPGHGAFVALGSGPRLIEVCHWIFENDMTWTISD
ncbi:hypothetical protein C3L33_00710, partial [Rhododendron williamsianum]